MLRQLPNFRQRGFSLVELMVAVALIGILSVLGVSSYQNWIQNTRIHNAAESIQSGLQKARAEAVKRNNPVRFVLGLNSAWTVGCNPVVPDNDGDGFDDCPATIESRQASEGSSADITAVAVPAGNNIVEFNNLGGVNVVPAPFTQVNIDSTALSAADSRDLQVRLGAGGSTRMCDPDTNLSTSDPRRC